MTPQPSTTTPVPRRHLRLVDEGTVAAAQEAVEERAREMALRLLTSRSRTTHEIATALMRRGVDEGTAAAVVERLTVVGLLDDAAYARSYADQEAGRKGPRAVVDALQRRGIPSALAREVAFRGEGSDVRAAALAVGRAALPRWRGLERPVVQRRLAGVLARRGYDADVVRSVVGELLAGEL